MTTEEEYECYRECVTRHAEAIVLDVYTDHEVHKYHVLGRDSFMAICTLEGKFKRFVPHVRLN